MAVMPAIRRGVLIQNEYLALGFTGFAIHHLFAVHLQKIGGLFDEPVHLGGRHVMVPGQSDEHGLAAAFLGQEKLSRGQVRVHGDGVGPLEIVNGQAEGLGDVGAGAQVVFDQQRDDFGVRGNRRGNRSSGCLHGRFEFKVVVDIAVEAGVG